MRFSAFYVIAGALGGVAAEHASTDQRFAVLLFFFAILVSGVGALFEACNA